jgi:hypothetical protein
MNDEYLWNKSGEPDPEIQKLEELLGHFQHNRPLRPAYYQSHWKRYAAIAAALFLIAAVTATLLLTRTRTTWDVAILKGTPKVGSRKITASGKIAVGEVLETDGESQAKIDSDDVGEVTIDPNTRLRLLTTRTAEHRLSLEHGVIHAYIWAPPGQFFVNTPSATAVDLGCQYTLSVDESGKGLVKVELGWVAFESHGHESFIPAGAACETNRETGPGIPYYLDASQAFQQALKNTDFTATLAEARPRDAMTLWHLLPRVSAGTREQVYDRLAVLAPPPKDVTRAGVLALNHAMLDSWWNSLGLDDADWWRHWKRAWLNNP